MTLQEGSLNNWATSETLRSEYLVRLQLLIIPNLPSLETKYSHVKILITSEENVLT